MRVVSLLHVINGSGYDELEGITCIPDQELDLPDDRARNAHALGLVRIIREGSLPKPEEIETTLAPPAPERAVSKRGVRGRFVKIPDDEC